MISNKVRKAPPPCLTLPREEQAVCHTTLTPRRQAFDGIILSPATPKSRSVKKKSSSPRLLPPMSPPPSEPLPPIPSVPSVITRYNLLGFIAASSPASNKQQQTMKQRDSLESMPSTPDSLSIRDRRSMESASSLCSRTVSSRTCSLKHAGKFDSSHHCTAPTIRLRVPLSTQSPALLDVINNCHPNNADIQDLFTTLDEKYTDCATSFDSLASHSVEPRWLGQDRSLNSSAVEKARWW